MSNNASTSPTPELSVENHTEVRKSEFHILNLGAGVQSTALYLMFLRGDLQLPPIDFAIFADTMGEPRSVYRHLEWMKSLNGPPILVRSKGKLSEHLLKGQNSTGRRFASIPAYTLRPDGTAGKVRRQCSMEYKIEVIQRTIRRDICKAEPLRTPKGVIVHQYIGISLDEAGRAERIKRAPRAKYLKVHFPLIDLFMSRANCLTYLADKVPHETPRSACTFCPFHSDYEWDLQKRTDPEAWAESVELDRALRVPGNVVNRKLDQQLFLHRSCVSLDLVQLDTRPDPRKAQLAINFSAECLGVCGV
jgi:hypothetical protein